MYKLRGQAGLSMIELLIALAISSFLILGVTQIYVDNKRNYLFQQGQAGNLDGGRFALMVLERQLAKTGYRRRPDVSFEEAFPAGTFTAGSGSLSCAFTEGQTIAKVNDETLCLRYQPRDPDELDCAGNALSSANAGSIEKPYTNPVEFVVERITVTGDELSCNGVLLVEGVEDVMFDFGVGPPGEREVTSYTPDPSSPIRSVRYALLMSSGQGNLGQGMASQVYCNWYGISPCVAPSDNNIYQVASSSMTLRNLMP